LFSDIEKNMETLDAIEAVAVQCHGESQRGKGIVAFCVLTKGTHLSENEIRELCFDILPKRAIPDRIVTLKTLPMLPNGKIDHQQLVSFLPKA
jgi:acyl-CoA synthetase (AMP-forming)/AMP-acid ligase II